MWVVAYLPEADQERAVLPKPERAALMPAAGRTPRASRRAKVEEG